MEENSKNPILQPVEPPKKIPTKVKYQQSIMLITKCCGKGFPQVAKLVERLKTEGITYALNTCAPRHCKDLLEEHGIEYDKAQRVPHFWVDGLIATCADLNDAQYVEHLVTELKKIKETK